MSKNKKKEDELKKVHIDETTINGVVKKELIIRLIGELMASPLKTLVGILCPVLVLLCRLWFLYAGVCAVIIIWNIINYIYTEAREKVVHERMLSLYERRAKEATKKKYKIKYQQKSINCYKDYDSNKDKRSKSFLLKISTAGGTLAVFLVIGLYQHFMPVQSIMQSQNPEPAAGGGTSTISGQMQYETQDESGLELPDRQFILEHPDIVCELSAGQIQYVFYVTLDGMADNVEEVNDHLQVINNSDRVSNAGRRTEIENGVINRASRLEEDFLEDIEAARQYGMNGNDLEWSDTIPSSTTLDDIIEMRSGFWSEDISSDKSDGELCFLLANNFQRYAQEYDRQEGKIPTVVYYYVLSILWTERAMSYSDITEENEKLYYDYLKARYKDISDYLLRNMMNISENENLIYYEVQLKAYIIYNAM